MKPRPEPGVSCAAAPTDEYRVHSRLEAAKGLAKLLGCTETRAAALLDDETTLVAEIRARQADSRAAYRALLRRLPPP